MKFKWKIEIDASQISITPLYLILNVLQLIRSDTEKYINKKNIKLQPVPPLMPSESLSVRLTGINSASNGINGVTGCNFIFFWDLSADTLSGRLENWTIIELDN